MRVRRHGWVMLGALAVLSTGRLAGAAPPDQRAQMRAAMDWLATPWSDAQEKVLEARQPPTDPKAPVHLPGSPRSYSHKQLDSTPPDWWPQDHPAMPPIVAVGRDKAMPCAECHLPSGAGMPHTASLAGLPAAYILEQLQAFRDGSRANDEMHEEVLGIAVADLRQAAEYFSGLRLASARSRVLESTQVPKTRIESWMLVPIPDAGNEPIGNRMIELPLSVEQVRLGDARAHYVAYVPSGSLARGRLLASTGAGTTTACASCHGADLRGMADIPALAGRSPTYLTRQLVQFALGGRHSPTTLPMQQEVSQLTLKDMIAVAAYAASLKP